MKQILLAGLLLSVRLIVPGQILTTDPPFPTQDDTITVFYNVSTGNAAISPSTNPVYCHTGIVTQVDADNCVNNWQYVQGTWGTADPDVIMLPQGGGNHKIDIYPPDFYDYPDGFDPGRLMFVFRNQSGSVVGRNADGSDIYLQLYEPGFHAGIIQPYTSIQNVNSGDAVNIHCATSETATFTLTVNGNVVATETSATSLDYVFSEITSGSYQIELEASNGLETLSDVLVINIDPTPIVADPPAGLVDGVNIIDNSTVILQLFAPNKDFVYVLGDFNNWQFSQEYMMKRNTSGDIYWLQIDNLDSDELYRYQYSIDVEDLRIADPYTHLVLDPWNDPWISSAIYPNMPDYPTCQTSQVVSTFRIIEEDFNWTDQAFNRPPKSRLIVYELLPRDFSEERSYQAILDSLDYLDNLGINCIELMPVNEFEGNDSWGYNPSFYFAPDKAYGTAHDLKELINECHNRGIAVILDIALNHSFGQSPMVRMYFDEDSNACNDPYGAPTPDNPWFNECATHPFSVGYDFDHESVYTRNFCKRVLAYWMEEFHVDGYRFDLSKGFTQENSGGNIGLWNDYNQERINILSDYYSAMQTAEPGSYAILEHLSDNAEETALANMGMMLWGKMTTQYEQATMGYSDNSDLSWGSYVQRGWNSPHLVTYAESHDEERLMYKNLQFGNSSGAYDIQNLQIALDRVELAHAFLIPVPGPKMIWQFGELGYDYSINYCPEDGTINADCRTYAKPVRWDYRDVAERYKVYKVIAALNNLKNTEALFSTTDFDIDLGGLGKRIHLNGTNLNCVVVGNFNVNQISMIPGFQHTGTWYDYFTGASFAVDNQGTAFNFQPGEYHLYFDQQMELPDTSVHVGEAMKLAGLDFMVWPNPANDQLTIGFDNGQGGAVQIELLDLSGKVISVLARTSFGSGNQQFVTPLTGIPEGAYLIRIQNENGFQSHPVILAKGG